MTFKRFLCNPKHSMILLPVRMPKMCLLQKASWAASRFFPSKTFTGCSEGQAQKAVKGQDKNTFLHFQSVINSFIFFLLKLGLYAGSQYPVCRNKPSAFSGLYLYQFHIFPITSELTFYICS